MHSRTGGQGDYTFLRSNDAVVSRLAEQDQVPWYSKPNLRRLYLLMGLTCLGVEVTSGFDASMVNGLQAVPSWIEYFHHPRSVSLGLIVAVYALGSFVASPFAPIAVDKFGRRYPIFLGAAISIVGSVLQGLALNFAMFVIARFILGVGAVFCIVAASSLVGELSHPKERAVMSALLKTSYFIGAVAAAAVTLETFAMTSNLGWRIPSFLQVVPSLLQVFFIRFLPESPRWLISNGRGDEAYSILVRCHAEGDENSEFVKAEYAQIEDTLRTELKIAQTNQKKMISAPGMRRRVVVATFLALFNELSGLGLFAYFLAPILDSVGVHDDLSKNIIGLARVSWGLINGTAIAFIVPRYPRRMMFLTCAISLFIVFTAWTIASADYSMTHSKFSAQIVIVLIFLYSPAYNIGYTALPYTYLVELFPFHVRARGIALFQRWYRGASFVAQFVNPIGTDLLGWRFYIFYCVWIAFQVVFVYFMFPETSGRTLEELAFLYEDEREAITHGVTEILCEQGEAETYGTMEGPGNARGDDESS